ncbi:MAG: molybdopterin molybdotransferase MoeA [Gammaproteobacteria bacterium]|nr:molybdopterin molybdotransferase MoeA [Gammaproteobacteria bacterium]MDH5800412.1 molybdopterin molybdotransferase MoeA [Gammaproteobacteria bacterium]
MSDDIVENVSSKKRSIASCCSDSIDPSLSLSQAQERIQTIARSCFLNTFIHNTLLLPIREALGYTLAHDVKAMFDVPAHTNSAMDGFALNGAALSQRDQRQFLIAGTALAGKPYPDTVKPGNCVRIMTGAAIPSGCDTVIPQELTQCVDNVVTVGAGHQCGENVRYAGEDLAKNDIAIQAGTPITATELGLLASLGTTHIEVTRKPKVAFFSTGDELRPVGTRLGPGEIHDSNRYTLYGMLTRLGLDLQDLGVIKDNPSALRAALEHASRHADVIISSGGVSVGDADYIKDVLDEIGAVDFWKIAIKPGRPLAFGTINGKPFFGLPGNPVAVMVTFYQLVRPALLTLAGLKANPAIRFKVPCASRLKKKPGRVEFYRGVLESNELGETIVRSSGKQGSGVLSSMSRANCFIVLPQSQGTVEPGDPVDVEPFEGLV